MSSEPECKLFRDALIRPLEAARPAKQKSASKDWTEMVTIECKDLKGVEQAFLVHKSFITYHSPYYSAAFNGGFSEGHSQSIKQETISVEAFDILIRWIYTQKLEGSKGETPCIKDLLNVWIIADEKLMPRLQNHVIETLNEAFARQKAVPTNLFRSVYRHTMDGSALRCMIVDLCLGKMEKSSLIEFSNRFPREMLVDLLKASDSRHFTGSKFTKPKLKKYFVDEVVPASRSA